MSKRKKPSDASSVRYSRDGDQFHYLWAARLSLKLLDPKSEFSALAIESSGSDVNAGEDVIDVAELFGAEDPAQATLTRYTQLKHSTKHASTPWPLSGLKKTLVGFGKRYLALVKKLSPDQLKRFEFRFISNRPISPNALEALKAIQGGAANASAAKIADFKTATGLRGADADAFCAQLTLEGGVGGYGRQRTSLELETQSYLAGDDADAPIRLKDLVTEKALSPSADNPFIRRTDVLRSLRTSTDRLFPAESRMEDATGALPRLQESEFGRAVTDSAQSAIIHAEGGVGKSILAQRLAGHLPAGSVAVVYDCFGNGEYRQRAKPRHRHKDALVQICNELARKGLCEPLIPTTSADDTDYLRAFQHRVRQAIKSVRATTAEAVVCVVVDAADNAQMAAMEFGDERAFALDLIRETPPEGARYVFLCRTERIDLLNPPPETLRLELHSFALDETKALLHRHFPAANDHDAAEFHRLTSHNPRVQALMFSRGMSLEETLRALGPDPTTVDAAIGEQLRLSIEKLRDAAQSTSSAQIELICTGLAILRPLVPISVLAAMSGVSASAIRSFATDLGRPLLVLGDTIQFRDEPVETWFRQQYRPANAQLSAFIQKLHPLANTNAYVASSLPSLMLEAGQLKELVQLALTAEKLPHDSPIEKRDVETQRVQFALKASLRASGWIDAAKLAMKAGEEAAGTERQQKLFQTNTDLVAALLDADAVQDIAARKGFGGKWPGARHAYEAGLLSHKSELGADARSRLRVAEEWLRSWARLPSEKREREPITNTDIAEMVMADHNLRGPKGAIANLSRWTPKTISFGAGKQFVRRLIDLGRYAEVDALAQAATDDFWLLMAIAAELRKVRRLPPKNATERAVALALAPRTYSRGKHYRSREDELAAAVCIVEAALAHGGANKVELAQILAKFLPAKLPRGLDSRHDKSRRALLPAYCLRAALLGKSLKARDLAHTELRRAFGAQKKQKHSSSQDTREFDETIGAVLPWYKLRADIACGEASGGQLAERIGAAQTASRSALSYREDSHIADEIALLWFDALLSVDLDTDLLAQFEAWIAKLRRPLFTPTLIAIARAAARHDGYRSASYRYAERAFNLLADAKEDAETKAQTFVAIARALASHDLPEANAYFDKAVEVTNKLGDDAYDRWQAILDLAERTAGSPCPQTSYRLARAGEVVREYLHDHFDWDAFIASMFVLDPATAIASVSRWRDRSFGDFGDHLPTLLKNALGAGQVSPLSACAFVAFKGDWDYEALARTLLTSNLPQPRKQSGIECLLRYMRLEHISARRWYEFSLTLQEFGVNNAEAAQRATAHQAPSDGGSSKAIVSEDWTAVFDGVACHTIEGITTAWGRFWNREPPREFDAFWSALMHRVAAGKEAAFIGAIADVAEVNLYQLRSILDGLPSGWLDRQAFHVALKQTTMRFMSRYCLDITKGRKYHPYPLSNIAESTRIDEQELMDEVLHAIGLRSEVVGSGRLFTIIGLLASKLAPSEAKEALVFSLDLLDANLSGKDGDGAWVEHLSPKSNSGDALAGLLWSALGASRSAVRWEAAHCVRSLCWIDAPDVLGALGAFASDKSAIRPFADARFVFYRLHSLQWFSIALARAAFEQPQAAAKFYPIVEDLALRQEPHVIIRHYAAIAATQIHRAGVVTVTKKTSTALTNVNKSKIAPTIGKRNYGSSRKHDRKDEDERRFVFGYDIDRYWFEPLANCFNVTSADVEDAAEEVILKDWALTENGHWENDARAKAGIFRNQEEWHSHSSYPKADDLNFYLSSHSTFTAAGKLLQTRPLNHDPDRWEDEFEGWMRRHLISRTDGRWLFDARSPNPVGRPSWTSGENDSWKWEVMSEDFDRHLGLHADRLNLWGDWDIVEGQREESVRVTSSLVTSAKAQALLRALQSADNPRDFGFPEADDDDPDSVDRLSIDIPHFQLKGWVNADTHDVEVDRDDPWATETRFPPPQPMTAIKSDFTLAADADLKTWTRNGREVMWGQTWAERSSHDRETPVENGRRLQVSPALMREILAAAQRSLIIEVQIQRRIIRRHYESRDYGEIEYPHPYFKIYLLHADGRFQTLRGDS